MDAIAGKNECNISMLQLESPNIYKPYFVVKLSLGVHGVFFGAVKDRFALKNKLNIGYSRNEHVHQSDFDSQLF